MRMSDAAEAGGVAVGIVCRGLKDVRKGERDVPQYGELEHVVGSWNVSMLQLEPFRCSGFKPHANPNGSCLTSRSSVAQT
ncbi:hypothetical protein EMIT0158MI4_130088 [Burkholderia ambifaria]